MHQQTSSTPRAAQTLAVIASACVLALGTAGFATAAQPQGARLVKDINLGPDYSSIDELTAARGRVYFRAEAHHGDAELWVSNGTSKGTRRVKDIYPGRRGSWPGAMMPGPRGLVYFWARGRRGAALWTTDGTRRGTRPLKLHGPSGGLLTGIAYAGGALYFVTRTGSRQTLMEHLWRSDGTAAGTALVRRCRSLDDLTPAGSRVFFTCTNLAGLLGTESIMRADRSGAVTVFEGEGLCDPTALGSNVFFCSGRDRSELWTSDGTAAGTQPVLAGENGNYGGGLFAAGGRLYYLGNRPRCCLIWTSDGSATGTRPLTDATGRSFPNYSPERFAAAGGFFYFVQTDETRSGEVRSLWRSDGSPAGTVRLHTVRRGGFFGGEIIAARSRVYFNAPGGLWTSDGTRGGTTRVSPRFYDDVSTPVAVGDRLFFYGQDRAHGTELWATFSHRRR